ncbi:cell wall metabolism sensor histidine kinase WalK [Granulicella sp. S190]|uniref:sensor histidine kinase n=1 Tax=Granulicella sp. S190 TaxID=1747226 RepID=UPI00131B9B77|nr:ATP-binding protein [Granulicella sp. S190]
MRLRSIKMQLIASVLLVELVSALLGTGLAVLYERHARFHAFDIMLRGRADSLLGAVQDAEDTQDNVMLDGSEINLPKEDLYEVWDQDLRVLGHSAGWRIAPNAGEFATSAKPFQKIRVMGEGYRTIRIDGVRVVDPGDKGGGVLRHVTIVYGSPTSPIWEAVWGAVYFYGVTSMLLVVLTGLGMYWLLRRGLAPLDELAVQASGLSVDSWGFVPSSRVRETAELAPLAKALETAMQGLERSFTQQHRFVSDAAHELKTAVAVIKSSLQLLAMKPRSAKEYQAGLERCQDDCSRMEEIVAKMLTLARIESSLSGEKRASSVLSTDVAEVVKRVAGQLETYAELNKVGVELSVPASVTLDIEEEELELLCSNLLMNALQHSKQSDVVRVTGRSMGVWLELIVADEGSGIEAEYLPYVFDRFYRNDPSRSRRTGGTGLGLAICKAIVAKAKGSLELTSKSGSGTTAIVRLRLERDFIAWDSTRASEPAQKQENQSL